MSKESDAVGFYTDSVMYGQSFTDKDGNRIPADEVGRLEMRCVRHNRASGPSCCEPGYWIGAPCEIVIREKEQQR